MLHVGSDSILLCSVVYKFVTTNTFNCYNTIAYIIFDHFSYLLTFFKYIFKHIVCPLIRSILEDRDIYYRGIKTGLFQHPQIQWQDKILESTLAQFAVSKINPRRQQDIVIQLLPGLGWTYLRLCLYHSFPSLLNLNVTDN